MASVHSLRRAMPAHEAAELSAQQIEGLAVAYLDGDIGEAEYRKHFAGGPVFVNDVPHSRGEKVVQPTGMPPAEWSIA